MTPFSTEFPRQECSFVGRANLLRIQTMGLAEKAPILCIVCFSMAAPFFTIKVNLYVLQLVCSKVQQRVVVKYRGKRRK
jgi:hypothetical protein